MWQPNRRRVQAVCSMSRVALRTAARGLRWVLFFCLSVYLFSGTGIRNLVKLPLANLNCLSEIKLLVTKFIGKWGSTLYYDCIIIQSTL